MKLFLSFTRLEFLAAAMYRQEFWLRILNNLVVMYGAYWLWNTLYERAPQSFPVSREQMLAYGMLAMLMDTVFFATNQVRYYIMGQVRTGAIQMDLLRPLDFLFHLLARNVGQMAFSLLTLGLPGYLAGMLLLGLRPSSSLQDGLLFLVSLVPAYLTAFALNFLVGMVSVYTLNIQRIGWLYYAVLRFFSGQLVPLWFFPPLLALMASLLPFRGIIGIPLSIYIGKLPIDEALVSMGTQALWAAALLAACHAAWSRAHARLAVQGG
jgi:ABC-2 type transport system permease protein